MATAAGHNSQAHWYLFLFSPFVAGLLALKNYKFGWAKNVLWGFIVFYGFTLGISKETSNSSDINRYIYELQAKHRQQFSKRDIVELYQKNKDIDVARLTIAIVLSRLTDYPPVLTAVYALIFGFFFSRNLWYILDRLKGKLNLFTILFIVTFVLVNPFWNINGFRFYTAEQIFIYGLLPYLFEGKKKGLLIACTSFLFHFSFLLPLSILGIYVLIRNQTLIFFIFFLATSVTSAIEIGSFNAMVEANAPEALSERTYSYRSERYVKSFRTGIDSYNQRSSWHAVYYTKALNWTLTAFVIFLFLRRKTLAQLNKGLVNALCFTLLMWGVGNLMSSLPSGGRYITVAYLSALPLVIFYIHYMFDDKLANRMKLISVPFLLLFGLVSLREGFYTLSVNTIIGNPLVSVFVDYNFALNDLIK